MISETMVPIYQTTRRHMPEHCNHNAHNHEGPSRYQRKPCVSCDTRLWERLFMFVFFSVNTDSNICAVAMMEP
jgi:hypothetical protein